jgi:hypothetical protein
VIDVFRRARALWPASSCAIANEASSLRVSTLPIKVRLRFGAIPPRIIVLPGPA